MMRLFVGLGLPPDLAARLESLEAGIPGARWVAARNMHITLRFVGEVDEGIARDLHDELAAIQAPAFALPLTGFGTFGRDKPNHLWAAVEKTAELSHLQAKVESAAQRAGLQPEPRKFTPHVTLARFKDAPVTRLQDFITRNSPFQAGPFPVEYFTLFRSHLGRGGAEYEAVAEYPLG